MKFGGVEMQWTADPNGHSGYLMYDPLGSASMATDLSGNVLSICTSDLFGTHCRPASTEYNYQADLWERLRALAGIFQGDDGSVTDPGTHTATSHITRTPFCANPNLRVLFHLALALSHVFTLVATANYGTDGLGLEIGGFLYQKPDGTFLFDNLYVGDYRHIADMAHAPQPNLIYPLVGEFHTHPNEGAVVLIDGKLDSLMLFGPSQPDVDHAKGIISGNPTFASCVISEVGIYQIDASNDMRKPTGEPGSWPVVALSP